MQRREESTENNSAAATWVDQQVTFTAGGMTIYGTYRHPAHSTGNVPAALLIAGSGPTDRDGNDAQMQNLNTLKTVADWLSSDGVATLRYDKLGSGKTGLGTYTAATAAQIDVSIFTDEATSALQYLSKQSGVDPQHLSVVGHSEGALYALLLATKTGTTGGVPKIAALMLLEPSSIRLLDVLKEQIEGQIAAAEKGAQLAAATGATLTQQLDVAITSIRTTGTVPPNLPKELTSVFNPANAKYIAEIDAYDPASLAAKLPPSMPVLTSCSNADIQVTCDQVQHLIGGLSRADLDAVKLTGVDHMLKEDNSRDAANYDKSLPFSTVLRDAIKKFTSVK
ncbi:MAG: hypothetical protein ABI137_04785 [Antricoccus sp.]